MLLSACTAGSHPSIAMLATAPSGSMLMAFSCNNFSSEPTAKPRHKSGILQRNPSPEDWSHTQPWEAVLLVGERQAMGAKTTSRLHSIPITAETAQHAYWSIAVPAYLDAE